LSDAELETLTPDELAELHHHEIEVARLQLAACERRKEIALRRFRAAKQASKKDRA